MKKIFSIILLIAIIAPMSLNTAMYAQNKKSLFYLMTDKQKEARDKERAKKQTGFKAHIDDGKVYSDSEVDQKPEFPGGKSALSKYIKESINYPAAAAENGIQGTAFCQFVVNSDGSISDVKIIKSAGDPSLDKEAIRVVQTMPKWNPGMNIGQKVRVKTTASVPFRLY